MLNARNLACIEAEIDVDENDHSLDGDGNEVRVNIHRAQQESFPETVSVELATKHAHSLPRT